MIKVIRKVKGLLYKFGFHKLVCKYEKKILTMVYLAKASKFINENKKCKFSDFYSYNFNHSKRYTMYDFVLKSEHLNNDVIYLEFGVEKGSSIKWWSENIKNANAKFYGFDTFEGLPEDWGGYQKGSMSANGSLPDINDNRIEFIKGLFQKTLPKFLVNKSLSKKLIVHLDADLYSSTQYVLWWLSPYLKAGDILLFDEFNVPMHEVKAFCEFVSSSYIKYKVIANVNNFYQTAIKIISIPHHQ